MANESNGKNSFRRGMDAFAKFLRSFPVTAILLILAGAMLIAFPEGALHILLRVVGVLVILYGVLQIFALLIGADYAGFGVLLFFGLLWDVAIVIAGTILIAAPDSALAFLAVIAGVYLIVDSVIKLYRILMARAVIAARFGIVFDSPALRVTFTVCCLMTLVAGILLLAFPRESARSMAILAGASLVVDGIQTVVYHLSGRKPKDKNAPIETTDYEDKT